MRVHDTKSTGGNKTAKLKVENSAQTADTFPLVSFGGAHRSLFKAKFPKIFFAQPIENDIDKRKKETVTTFTKFLRTVLRIFLKTERFNCKQIS